MNRSRQANADIRARALVQGEESEPWPFECECGEPDCREHVTLSVARYDEVRRVTGHVIAAPHRDRYYRARQARAQAAEIREEARAVRAQAALQIRRTLKLRRLGA